MMDRLILRALSNMQRVTWGKVRWFLIVRTLSLKLEIDAKNAGVFHA